MWKLNLGFPKTSLAVLLLGSFLTTYGFTYCIWIHSVSQILLLYMDVPVTTASLLNGLNLENTISVLQLLSNMHIRVWVCTQLLSHVQLFATSWTVTCQAPLSIEVSRQEYWSGLPFLNPGIKPAFLASPALAGDSLSLGYLESHAQTNFPFILLDIAWIQISLVLWLKRSLKLDFYAFSDMVYIENVNIYILLWQKRWRFSQGVDYSLASSSSGCLKGWHDKSKYFLLCVLWCHTFGKFVLGT